MDQVKNEYLLPCVIFDSILDCFIKLVENMLMKLLIVKK
jgi:hypothetical protein